MTKKCIIYLADLVHNYRGKGPFTFPINIGYISAYAKDKFGDKVDIRLFKFPLNLIHEIQREKPDIVGFGNYTWNLDLNSKLIDYIKSISKDILTIFGGPNYPSEKVEIDNYIRDNKNLDFYVLFQGEVGFSNIIKEFLEKRNIEKIKETSIENCAYLKPSKNQVIIGDVKNFKLNLEEVPSPYLIGILDDYFETSFIPMIETNRGCPYSCTYCSYSQYSFTKFPLERIEKEIEYISEKVKNSDLIMITDANFGILERDIEIARFIKSINEKMGYPRFADFTFDKKTSDRIIKIGDIFGDLTSITTSFQSLNPTVLKNVKRTNISIDEYKKIQQNFNSKHIPSHSELILGLPGETKQSHEEAIRNLFDFGTRSIACYNLKMLGGAELTKFSERKKYELKTEFRLVDNGFGKYDDILSFESVETVLGTNTISRDEILYFRPIHWLIQFMWNYKYYAELLHFLKLQNINPLDFIIQIINLREYSSSTVNNIIDEFIEDSYSEWFSSREELKNYYSQPSNFQSLEEGSFGKLNFKYTYRILIECKKDFDSYLFLIASLMLIQNQTATQENILILKNIFKFLKSSYVDFIEGTDLIPEKFSSFDYDILKWRTEDYSKPLNEYIKKDVNYHFYFSDEQSIVLKRVFKQFEQKEINFTLRKMAEYMTFSDLFYQISYNKKKK